LKALVWIHVQIADQLLCLDHENSR